MPSTENTPFDSREPLEEAARRAGELFVEIYRGLEQRSVAPAVERAALLEQFAGTLGDDGVGLLAALGEFRERGFTVLPGGQLSIACAVRAAARRPVGGRPASGRDRPPRHRHRTGVVLDRAPRRPHLAAVQHGESAPPPGARPAPGRSPGRDRPGVEPALTARTAASPPNPSVRRLEGGNVRPLHFREADA